ncbi:GDSL family lipase [Nonlabens sp. YIK11]|nr:GDSL family lipase [Nonlabens sp. YIK11]
MLKSKTMETLFNRAIYKQRILLNFCYFLCALSLFSCKNDTAPTTETTTETTSQESEEAQTSSDKTILFFGDSLTAGYGLDDTADAFPGVIQEKIDAAGLDYQVVNSGISGETTAGGKSRIDWTLNQKIDVFVLELGANDGLRGVPVSETRANLQAIIDAVRASDPETKIVLAGMQLPPNMGQQYTSEFKSMFSDLATENNIFLIPFLLEDVGGVPSLNQNDGIHPTVEGHKILADNVWQVLEGVISTPS